LWQKFIHHYLPEFLPLDIAPNKSSLRYGFSGNAIVLLLIISADEKNLTDPLSKSQASLYLFLTVCRRDQDPKCQAYGTGPGLPREISKNLFTAFRTTKNDGMGVGLSVSRTIIESLGGRIWAESGSAGTTFLFTVSRSEKTAPRG